MLNTCTPMSPLPPVFFNEHCTEVVLSRAVVGSAVLDMEHNAAHQYPQIGDFRQTASKVNPCDVDGAMAG